MSRVAYSAPCLHVRLQITSPDQRHQPCISSALHRVHGTDTSGKHADECGFALTSCVCTELLQSLLRYQLPLPRKPVSVLGQSDGRSLSRPPCSLLQCRGRRAVLLIEGFDIEQLREEADCNLAPWPSRRTTQRTTRLTSSTKTASRRRRNSDTRQGKG